MRSLIAAIALAALPASAQEEETGPVAAPAAEAPAAEPAPAPAPAPEATAEEAAADESAPDEPTPKPKAKPKRTRRAPAAPKPAAAPAPAVPAAPAPEPSSAAETERVAREKLEAFHEHVQAMGEEAANDRPPTEDELALGVAADFIHLVLAGDARSLVDVSAVPFYFEGTRLNDRDAVFASWLRAAREKRVDLLTLYGVELYTPDEMEKKYGKPPARLSALPWRGPGTWIAVANVSGRARVLVLKKVADMDVRVVGYTD